MTKSKAIKIHCFDCAGESNKDVTLCPVFDCPLWPFRTGQGPTSNGYKSRMMTAKTNYAEDLTEMAREGYEISRFFQFSTANRRAGARKPPRSIVRPGGGKFVSADAHTAK